MPTLEYVKNIPDFPSDIQVVHTSVISLKDLQNNSEKASDDLFEASSEHGFFWLNLQDSESGMALLKHVEAMFEVSKLTFNLGKEVLLKHTSHPPSLFRGYKPTGVLKAGKGKFDTIEMYTLLQDEILGNCDTTFLNPEPLESYKTENQSFLHHAHDILLEVFSHLNKQLGIAPGTLAGLCRLDKHSDTSVRLLLTRPGSDTADANHVALGGHTDIGLITMVFTVVGGAQILPAGSENIPSNWRYIMPQPGCVLFQIGDTLAQLTGGVLHSPLHRVVTPPGEQGLVIRQSFVYLVRIENDASMRRLKSDGSVIPELAEGEEDEERTPSAWAKARIKLVVGGLASGGHSEGPIKRIK